jgi:hypothetical protein
MIAFIDDHRDKHGVEPICDMLPIAPATYYDHLAKRADPARLSDRARRDEELRPHIQRVFDANWQVYGVRKVWRHLCREGFDVARCTCRFVLKCETESSTKSTVRVALKCDMLPLNPRFLPLKVRQGSQGWSVSGDARR